MVGVLEYSMRVLVQAPLTMADREAGMTMRIVPVSGVCILGYLVYCVQLTQLLLLGFKQHS